MSYYKTLLQVSVESLSTVAGLGMADSTSVPVVTVLGVDSNLLEAGVSLDVTDEAEDRLCNISDTLMGIREQVANSLSAGGLTESEAKTLQLAVEHLMEPTGLINTLPDPACFKNNRVTATTVSMEAISEVLKSLAARIRQLIVDAVERIAEYIGSVERATGRLTDRVGKIEEQIGSLTGKAPQQNQLYVSDGHLRRLMVNGQFQGLLPSTQAYRAMLNDILGQFLSAVPGYFTSLADLMNSWAADPSTFNGESPYGSIKGPTMAGLNPKSMTVETHSLGTLEIHFDNGQSLLRPEWVARQDEGNVKGDINVDVLPAQAIHQITSGVSAVAQTISSAQPRITQMNEARRKIADSVQKLGNLDEDAIESDKRQGIQDAVRAIYDSVKAYNNFVLKTAGMSIVAMGSVCDLLGDNIQLYHAPKQEQDQAAQGA